MRARPKGFLGGSAVKNSPAADETWVQPLGQEEPLDQEIANYTPEFSPGESNGQRTLAGYSPQGCKESDMTEHA